MDVAVFIVDKSGVDHPGVPANFHREPVSFHGGAVGPLLAPGVAAERIFDDGIAAPGFKIIFIPVSFGIFNGHIVRFDIKTRVPVVG